MSVNNRVPDGLSRSNSTPQRISPPRPRRPDALFSQAETNKPLPMIPQNRQSLTESQIHTYIPRPLQIVAKPHQQTAESPQYSTPDRTNPRLLSKDHTGHRSARAALPPSELREHLRDVSYDPKSLSTSKSSSPNVPDIERILSPRTRVTGLRRRNTSSIYYPPARHTRSASESTIQTNMSVNHLRSLQPSFSSPLRRRTASVCLDKTSYTTPMPPEHVMRKFSSRDEATGPTNHTPISSIQASPTSMSPSETVFPFPRKPLPLRSRTTSSPTPSPGHGVSSTQTYRIPSTRSYMDPNSSPLRPEILSVMSTGSSFCRVSDSEPRSGWDSDDSDEDQTTLMGRVRSTLQLPSRNFTFNGTGSSPRPCTPSEKTGLKSSNVNPAVEKRRSRGGSLSNKVSRMGRAMLCGC